MERKALFGGMFCILLLDLSSVGTSNMAAIKIQQKRVLSSGFLEFMGDLMMEIANKPQRRSTFLQFILRGYALKL